MSPLHTPPPHSPTTCCRQADLKLQTNRQKKQTEQISELQRKARAQSTKLKGLREENSKLAQGLGEAGIDVKKLLAMKLENVVAVDLPLKGEGHTREVEERQAALREERDKVGGGHTWSRQHLPSARNPTTTRPHGRD